MQIRLVRILQSLVALVVLMVLGVGRYWWSVQIPVLNLPAPRPTPFPNGLDLYLKAADSIDPGQVPVDEIYDPERLPPGSPERAQRYSLARRQQWLQHNAAGFALFNQARAAESLQPSSRVPNAVAFPHKKARALARFKVVQAKVFEDEKKWRQAADARLDVMEMGIDVSRGGALIPALVDIACEAIALDKFDPLVPHLSATDCFQLNARISKLWKGRPLFSQILTEEKYSYQQTLVDQWKAADAAHPSLSLPPAEQMWTSLLWSRRGVSQSMSQMTDDYIAQADTLFRLRKPIQKRNYYQYPLSHIMQPVLERALFNSTRSFAGPQGLQLRLALRAYYLERKTYPATLSQLAPKYLSKIPIDPYGTGQIWKYRREANSYCAWSIGPDGKDDGGKPIPPKSAGKRVLIWTDSVGDVVVRP